MWNKFLLIFPVLCLTSAYLDEGLKTVIKDGMRQYARNGTTSASLEQALRSMNFNKAFRKNAPENIDNSLLCVLCEIVVAVAVEVRRIGITTEQLVNLIVSVCVLLDVEPRPVCEGAISSNADTVLYMIDNKEDIVPSKVCAIFLQDSGCEGPIDFWQVNVAEGKTIDVENGKTSDSEPFKVLQITDIHYDPMYLPGGLANCAEPLCCQSDIGLAEDPRDAAGYWGDYRDCDTPRHVVLSAFDHINQEHIDEIEYIYYTGDVVSHRVWGTSVENNTRDLFDIFGDFINAFPGTPIFPIFGNHEPHPVNVYSPPTVNDPTVSTQWLFDDMAELWSTWLPESAIESVRRGGYYTVLLRPGFRLIAMNSNVGYTSNLWLLYDDVDPFGQLQWLADVLYQAEQNNEFVHILTHVPSGDGTCYLPWSREFRRIVERFSNTITAMFNGHSHVDEWLIYHSSEDPTLPISVAWNGGSITSFSNQNSNFKIYTVDSENFEILDFDSWIFNLTEANLTPELPPVWFKLYSFKDAFDLPSLAPKDIRNLIIRMTQDHSIMELHDKHRYRDADSRGSCSDGCMRSHLCRMVTMERGDNTQCDEFLNMWTQS